MTALQRWDDAVQDYDMTLKLAPTVEPAWFNRGFAYRRLGQNQKAITDYTQAIKLDPNDADAYGNRANLYDDTGRHEQAMQDYAMVLKIRPGDPLAHYNRGVSYRRHGDLTAALADFQAGLRRMPGDPDLLYQDAITAFLAGHRARPCRTWTPRWRPAPRGHRRQRSQPRRGCVALHGDAWLRRRLSGRTQRGRRQISGLPGSARGLGVAAAHRAVPEGPVELDQLLQLADTDDKLVEAHSYIGLNLSYSGHQDQAVSHLEYVVQHGTPGGDDVTLA